MTLTLYGLLVVGICLLMLLLKRPIREFTAGLIIFGVLGAAEAVGLPMLGGSSLTAPTFWVFFLVLRMLLMAPRRPTLLMQAFSGNIWIVLFAAYGILSAMFLPRIFEGAINVYAMRPQLWRTGLTFTPQNVTQTFYMTLTALSALAGYVTARSKNGVKSVLSAWTIASFLFIAFGLIDLVSFYAGLGNLLGWVRTANVLMLNQSDGGVTRISGSFPEPSSYASFGAIPLAIFAYRWVMTKNAGMSGPLALALAVMLTLSTSSTAFATVGLVFAMICVTVAFGPLPAKVRRQKFIGVVSVIAAGLVVIAAVAFLSPAFAEKFGEVVLANTVEKHASSSARDRGILAAQGFEAFAVSKGLGIGPGSFRSSGLIQAILGSTGVLGIIFVGMHLFAVTRVILGKVVHHDRGSVIAMGLASFLMLVPSILVSATPDLGIFYGLMSGLVIGLQRQLKQDVREASRRQAIMASPPSNNVAVPSYAAR